MNILVKNDQAIGFVKSDYLGNTIDLAEFKGKKILLSSFCNYSRPNSGGLQ